MKYDKTMNNTTHVSHAYITYMVMSKQHDPI